MREEEKMSMAARLTGGALALCLGLILPVNARAMEQKKAATPTPLNAGLVTIGHELVASGAKPGSMTEAELRKRLGL